MNKRFLLLAGIVAGQLAYLAYSSYNRRAEIENAPTIRIQVYPQYSYDLYHEGRVSIYPRDTGRILTLTEAAALCGKSLYWDQAYESGTTAQGYGGIRLKNRAGEGDAPAEKPLTTVHETLPARPWQKGCSPLSFTCYNRSLAGFLKADAEGIYRLVRVEAQDAEPAEGEVRVPMEGVPDRGGFRFSIYGSRGGELRALSGEQPAAKSEAVLRRMEQSEAAQQQLQQGNPPLDAYTFYADVTVMPDSRLILRKIEY